MYKSTASLKAAKGQRVMSQGIASVDGGWLARVLRSPILAVHAPIGRSALAEGGVRGTADQVKGLIKSHAEGDDTRFYSEALQVAAQAARSGKANFAQELRDLVDSLRQSPTRKSLRPVPVAQPRGELAGVLSVTYPDARMADLVLESAVRGQRRDGRVEAGRPERLRPRLAGTALTSEEGLTYRVALEMLVVPPVAGFLLGELTDLIAAKAASMLAR